MITYIHTVYMYVEKISGKNRSIRIKFFNNKFLSLKYYKNIFKYKKLLLKAKFVIHTRNFPHAYAYVNCVI